jgi:hypothetical protein
MKSPGLPGLFFWNNPLCQIDTALFVTSFKKLTTNMPSGSRNEKK